MQILDEKGILTKIKEGNFDLLDLLRKLNSKNINEDPERRDELFSALTIAENFNEFWSNSEKYIRIQPVYPRTISVSVLDSETSDILSNYSLKGAFSVFLGLSLRFTGTYLLVKYRGDAYHSTEFIGLKALLRIREIIKKDSSEFDIFKLKIIELFIKQICEYGNIFNNDNGRFSYDTKKRDVLNKLIVILIEHIKQLEPDEEYPWVITDDLVEILIQQKDRREWGQIVIDYVLGNDFSQLSQEQIIGQDNRGEVTQKQR